DRRGTAPAGDVLEPATHVAHDRRRRLLRPSSSSGCCALPWRHSRLISSQGQVATPGAWQTRSRSRLVPERAAPMTINGRTGGSALRCGAELLFRGELRKFRFQPVDLRDPEVWGEAPAVEADVFADPVRPEEEAVLLEQDALAHVLPADLAGCLVGAQRHDYAVLAVAVLLEGREQSLLGRPDVRIRVAVQVEHVERALVEVAVVLLL